jgi:hypothetical protein
MRPALLSVVALAASLALVGCGGDTATRTATVAPTLSCRAAVEVYRDAWYSPAVGEDFNRPLRASLTACPSQTAYLRAFREVMGFGPDRAQSDESDAFITDQCDLADRPRKTSVCRYVN